MTRFARRRAALALPAQAGKAAGLPQTSAQSPGQVTSRTRPHHLPHALGPRRQHRAQALVLGQWATALLGSLALAGTAQAQASQCVTPVHSFAYTGSIETYTAPSTGDYWIEAAGAEGGSATSSTVGPGRGATVGGKFQLTAGTALRVLVGQQALAPSPGWGNGGGGGSFVTMAAASLPNDQPLLVAGGGAGSGDVDNANKHGQAGMDGGAGSVAGGAGGTAGGGGAQPSAGGYTSGAGGGLLSDGVNNTPSTSGTITANGGQAFVNGGAGGTSSNDAPGGFGGGGAGTGFFTGGGGGGYSGGGAGRNPQSGGIGGGGGSFNASADPMAPLVGATAGNPGNGWVKICMSSAPAPMAITPSSLPQGVVGSVYSATTLTASGGWSPYSWSGLLPTGMSVNASGELTGTPAAGTAGSYTVTVSDAYQPPHTATLSFTVLDPLSITSSAQLPDATEGSAYSATLTATGGTPPYSWALAPGSSLPAGLSLNASTGEISNPLAKSAQAAPSTQAKATGTFSFDVQITDSSTPALQSTQTFSLQVTTAPVVVAPATVTPVPTLGAWALALLATLLGALTAVKAQAAKRQRQAVR